MDPAKIAATRLNPSGASQTLASSIAYQPFGPASNMVLGNSVSVSKTFDLNYQLADLLQTNGSTIYYYRNDHLGTPQHMTYSSANFVWSADYLPFGQADATLSTVENNMRFAGQYFDSKTGLHYNHHRSTKGSKIQLTEVTAKDRPEGCVIMEKGLLKQDVGR